ncbi:MAG: hypothetical protein RR444_04405 [Oscillospiraceae bacterium]
MAINLIKTYPDLLEILHFSPNDRIKSLRAIFDRDITNNKRFSFRGKPIYPIKTDGDLDMDREFKHLTTEEVEEIDDDGNKLPKKRVFEYDRSKRLHWIKHHCEEKAPNNISVFSVIERDLKKRQNVTKTYIYDTSNGYIVVFECQRNMSAYFLLTAYHLNRPGGKEKIEKLKKKKLDDVI